MILNGLTGCDGFTFNYLADHANLSRPVSIMEISRRTGYSIEAIRNSLKKLENLKFIERHRYGNGYAYKFKVIAD